MSHPGPRGRKERLSYLRVIPGLLLAGIVIYALFAYGDQEKVWAEIGSFAWGSFGLALGFVGASYALRWLKWQYYLNVLGVPLKRRDSVLVFIAGFVMCITPAKLGEALKAYFTWKMTGTPVARVAPVVLAERFTDLLAMVLLASLGMTFLPHGELILLLVVGILLGSLVILGQRWLVLRLLSIPKGGGLRRIANALTEAYESASILLSLKHLFLPVAISLPAWWMECLALECVLRGLDAQVGLLQSTVLYAFSTLAGAVSLLPGGLALTEGTLAGSLRMLCGLSGEKAATAVLLVRACTLWFAFGLGLMTCLIWRARLAGQDQRSEGSS